MTLEEAVVLGLSAVLGASLTIYFLVRWWVSRRRWRAIERIIAEKREADARRREP